jgi:cob(I)alamin adenosyltransferase
MKEISFESVTTRGGDGGKTSLMNGERRFKSDEIFSVLGDIDEASSCIGLARAQLISEQRFDELAHRLYLIQRNLLTMGGEIASPPPGEAYVRLDPEEIPRIEMWQKEYMRGLELNAFIIPGAAEIPARLDLARSVTRRAERALVAYIGLRGAVNLANCQIYLNRLSDFLFVSGRHVATKDGVDEY